MKRELPSTSPFTRGLLAVGAVVVTLTLAAFIDGLATPNSSEAAVFAANDVQSSHL